jgi:hypothetical protein
MDGKGQLAATGFSITVHRLAIGVGSARQWTIVDAGWRSDSHFLRS